MANGPGTALDMGPVGVVTRSEVLPIDAGPAVKRSDDTARGWAMVHQSSEYRPEKFPFWRSWRAIPNIWLSMTRLPFEHEAKASTPQVKRGNRASGCPALARWLVPALGFIGDQGCFSSKARRRPAENQTYTALKRAKP